MPAAVARIKKLRGLEVINLARRLNDCKPCDASTSTSVQRRLWIRLEFRLRYSTSASVLGIPPGGCGAAAAGPKMKCLPPLSQPVAEKIAAVQRVIAAISRMKNAPGLPRRA